MSNAPDIDDDFPVLTVRPSPGRRWSGIVGLACLGGLLIYVAAAGGPAPIWQAFYVALGLAALWAAIAMHRATDDAIVLTHSSLSTASGRHLASFENIASVDRSAFAFKPSHGFLVRLVRPEGRGWAPGLYWQRGRILGIGGTLPGGQTRAMADILSARLVARDKSA